MNKLSKELRLAFLLELQRQTIVSGKSSQHHWKRYWHLQKELTYERMVMELQGYILGNKFIKHVKCTITPRSSL